MTVSAPTDFPVADGYQAVEPGVMLGVSPMMMAGLVLLLALAVAIGWMMARRRLPDDDPCEAIYDAVKKAIGAASGAPRDQVVASARKLRGTLDDRLGAVLKVSKGLGGPGDDLDIALGGLGHERHQPGHGDPAKDEPAAAPSFVIHARRDVTIHAVEPARSDDLAEGRDGDQGPAAGHGTGSGSGSGGDHGSGHGKPVDANTQIANIRAAVHALSDHWTDKAARLAELRAARRQLTAAGDRVWKKS